MGSAVAGSNDWHTLAGARSADPAAADVGAAAAGVIGAVIPPLNTNDLHQRRARTAGLSRKVPMPLDARRG